MTICIKNSMHRFSTQRSNNSKSPTPGAEEAGQCIGLGEHRIQVDTTPFSDFFLSSDEEPEYLDFNMKFPPSGPGPSGKERRAILSLVLQHRDELYAEWEAKVDRGN